MIDDKHINADIPEAGKMVNQITSNQAVRAFIAVSSVALLAYSIVAHDEPSAVALTLLSTLLGYYFGENSPQPKQ